ncbi:MAG: hypothetical protein KatS3mg083_623 [Candidatus Dojkabacteria bacterium]|nr:MAG: hypothetical protein KatS3mg083_623 [Candidatus Dojkabacteria bacterium]
MSQNIVSVSVGFEIRYTASAGLETTSWVEFVDSSGIHHTISDFDVLYRIFGTPQTVHLCSTKMVILPTSGVIAYQRAANIFLNMILHGSEIQKLNQLSAGYFLDIVDFHRDKIEDILKKATIAVQGYIERYGIPNTAQTSRIPVVDNRASDTSVTNVSDTRFLRF